MIARLTDVVRAADATALPHPSCRPLVRGLLAVLDDPATGADPATTRHAWVALDLVAPVPADVPLEVTTTLRRTARLGAGDGLWVDVDVDGPDGALVRSRHVVSGALAARPAERGTLPAVARPGPDAAEAGTLVVDAATLAAYRRAAADTSTAHAVPGHASDAPADAGPIVPGLLALWSALAGAGMAPAHVEARFAAPLAVGAPVAVVVAGPALALVAGGSTVLRAHVR